MIAVRNNRKSGIRSLRFLRLLLVPVVLLALGLAGIPMAEAHGAHDHPEHSLSHANPSIAADNGACCDEVDVAHGSGACLNAGHCVACATGNAATLAPAPMPITRISLGQFILLDGLETRPAGHPPKAV